MIEHIRDTMVELGDKFAQQAREAKSAKAAKTAFDLAARAYKLAMESDKVVRRPVDLNMLFLAGIDDVEDRSEVWRQYCNFCLEHNTLPIRKSELFDKLNRLGFKNRKVAGVYKLIPPKNKPQILIEAAQQVHKSS